MNDTILTERVNTASVDGFARKMLDEALDLARSGLAVFPCTGKKPAEEGGKGCKDGTTDLGDVYKMWKRFPRSNIGIATGSRSGVWVLDVDGAEAESALAALIAKHGPLPDTVISLTGKGRHLFFRYLGQPIKNRNSDIGPGLDVKAEGGYVIAPPSVHPDTGKVYQWDDGVLPDGDAVADAPEWLVDLVSGPNKTERERSNAPPAKVEVKFSTSATGADAYYRAALTGECNAVAKHEKGGRNARLNKAALKLGGFVAGGGLERGEVERALLAAAIACNYVADDGENAALATIKSGLEAGIAKGPKFAPERENKAKDETPKQSNGSAPRLATSDGIKIDTKPPAKSNAKLPAKLPPKQILTKEAALEEFNEKYAVVNEAGKVVIYCPKHDTQLKRDTIERILFEDFRRMYMNQSVKVGTTKKGSPILADIGTVWLEHPERRQFLGGVVMDPTNRAASDCWNLWRGFNVEPKEGRWACMHDHIRDIICGGDEKLFTYVMGWLARMVQYPDQPGEVALVLRGKKGTGKGTLGNWMIRLFGQHGVHVSHAKHLVGNFNAHLRDAVFVFADEAFFAGDKANEGVLKSLITEPFITVEAKYQNAITIANMTHILMASNSEWVVPASTDERRFCAMDVLEDRKGDVDYFDEINCEMENGGLAAMLHDLLKRDISDFNVRIVPETKALSDQKALSLDSLNRWWSTVLQRGFVLRSRYGADIFTEWSDFVSTELLNRSYLQWCGETREARPMSREQLGKMMAEIYTKFRPRGFYPVYEVEALANKDADPAVMQKRPHGYTVGSLQEAQAAYSAKTKIDFDWGDNSDDDQS